MRTERVRAGQPLRQQTLTLSRQDDGCAAGRSSPLPLGEGFRDRPDRSPTALAAAARLRRRRRPIRRAATGSAAHRPLGSGEDFTATLCRRPDRGGRRPRPDRPRAGRAATSAAFRLCRSTPASPPSGTVAMKSLSRPSPAGPSPPRSAVSPHCQTPTAPSLTRRSGLGARGPACADPGTAGLRRFLHGGGRRFAAWRRAV